jgi:tetratricopeptide (TPR) repeat protein
MTRIRLRSLRRVALKVAYTCFLIAIGAFIVKLSLGAPSKSTERHLLVSSEIAAILGALAAIAAFVFAVQQTRGPKVKRLSLLSPHLLRDDPLIDRTTDMKALIKQIGDSLVVNCHGQQGAGKSYLLGHLADVVNGHRPPEPDHPRPKELSAALYFDLADAAGFEQIQAQVCQAAFGEKTGVWSEFVAYVMSAFTRRPVLLILDNMNTPGLWPSLGKAARQYLANRPEDKLLVGSIEPVVLHNVNVEHVPLSGLDLDATAQLVAIRGGQLSSDELADLHNEYEGLPLYVCLFIAHGSKLIPQLEPELRKLLSYASLFALVARQVSVAELELCPLANLDTHLDIAEQKLLLTPIPQDGRTLVKIHDFVRDAVLRVLSAEVSEAALFLFERACRQDETVDAALYAMFADPQQIGAADFDEVLYPVIRSAVRSRNYALLSNLHLMAAQSTRILQFFSADQNRYDLFSYGRASELAGLGQYAEAQEALLSSSIVRIRGDRHDELSELQADMRFLQADLAHLQNRYDEAAQMFEDLGEWAASAEQIGLQARCTWGHAHVLRHQGRDLDKALSIFNQALVLADASGELFAKAYSVTGATGVKVLTGVVADDEEDRLADIEVEIAMTSAHDGYMLEVWKSKAQVAWFHGREDSAFEIIEAAIERALALNDRLLYNLYFERAEYARFRDEHAAALDDYQRVLDFGNGNRDRNLITNALLGLVLLELSAGQWLHHGTPEEARASVLDARQMATEADIQITAGIADEVAAMLDDPMLAPQAIRLILL